MKALSRLSATFFLLLLVGSVACRKDGKEKGVASVSQDTMLLRDLAEANRNTATASAVDNSLTTVRAAQDTSFPGMAAGPSQTRPSDTRVVQQPTGSKLTPPLTAKDASGPTTVPTDRSPASPPISSSSDPCDSPDPADQRACISRSIAVNDIELNRTYQDLLAQARGSGPPDAEEQIRQSQRDWVKQRDDECRAQTRGEGGTLWAKARARCLAEYSARRTAELQRSLDSLRSH
jgi:uncharacterized protein YecT (DUF1311 family)